MNSAVLFIVFKRPTEAKRVLSAIRSARPKRLYIACDGPRSNVAGEERAVQEVRCLVSNIDWDCDAKYLFHDFNIGCRDAVSGAISWFFKHESEGIILEDDCLPHPDFFSFCDSLLNKYRTEPSIYTITGNNFQNGQRRGAYQYYFSKYSHNWGWATWARCWAAFDGEMSFWPEWRETADFLRKVPLSHERKFWSAIFDRMYLGNTKTWDYQWLAAVWKNGGLCVTPQHNLVSNIGGGPEATHTSVDNVMLNRPVFPLGPVSSHPSDLTPNLEADRYVFESLFQTDHDRRAQTWRRHLDRLYWLLGRSRSSHGLAATSRLKFAVAKCLYKGPFAFLALKLLNTLTAQGVHLKDIHCYRAQIMIKMGRPSDAIGMLKEEMLLFPYNTRADFLLRQLEDKRTVDDPAKALPVNKTVKSRN